MNIFIVFGMIILICCLTLLPGNILAAEKGLLIGLVPELNTFKQKDRYKPLGQYIAGKTGIDIRFTILSRYGNIIESFRKEKMDGAFFGSFTGGVAIQQLGLIPLVRPVNLNGSSEYWGYIIVRRDSNIRDVRDMQGKRMAFVEKATTAGYLFPLAFFREHGIASYEHFFREYYFAGSHDAAINAVLNKKADVGAVKSSVYDRIRQQNPMIDKELVIIAESIRVPENSLLVRKNLNQATIRSIKETLMNMDQDPEGRKILKEFGAVKFIETVSRDYEPVYHLAEKAGIDVKRYKWRNE